MWPTLNRDVLFQDLPVCLWPNDNQPEMDSRVRGGVSGREGIPGHELLHQREEQLEAHTWYKHQARVLVFPYLV